MTMLEYDFDESASAAAQQGTNVYVCNLPLTITLRKFRLMFGAYGTIIGARLVPRRKGHAPVGFVQYTTAQMAQDAIHNLNGREVDGVNLSVTIAKRDKDKGINNKPSPSLYVANLPRKMNEVEVHALFSRFGIVQSVRLLRFPDTGASKGTAVVRFDTLEHAMAAKEALHCLALQKHSLPLEVKYAESKEERLSRRDDATVKAKPIKEVKPKQTSSPPATTKKVGNSAPSMLKAPEYLTARTAVPSKTISEDEWLNQWEYPSTSLDGWSWLDEPESHPPVSFQEAPAARAVKAPMSHLRLLALPKVESKEAEEINSPVSASSHGCSSFGHATDNVDSEADSGPYMKLLLDFSDPAGCKEEPQAEADDELHLQLSKLEELSSLLALNWP